MDAKFIGSQIRVDAPAKLNLFLEILAKRPDGFHELETLMVTISIYDTLIVTSNTEGRTRLTCDRASGFEACRRESHLCLPPLPEEQNNLVYKVVERLRYRAGHDMGVTIRLIKRIPSEAGLGGASSDAAAALLAVNQLWNLRWSREQLSEIAAEIGSDVPFFLSTRRTGSTAAICRGRGERITPLPAPANVPVVVVKPQEGLSTAAVYRKCVVPLMPRAVDHLADVWRTGQWSAIRGKLFNRLQQVAEELSPSVLRMRQVFARLETVEHAMSGSGTSYFAICRSAKHARGLAARLRAARCGQVFVAMTC